MNTRLEQTIALISLWGGMETSHQQNLLRDTRYDVWRQETTDQDTGQPVCEERREGKTQVDHTQSVQRVEEQTTEITEVYDVTKSESYKESGVPG